jgi:hypothetical protein
MVVQQFLARCILLTQDTARPELLRWLRNLVDTIQQLRLRDQAWFEDKRGVIESRELRRKPTRPKQERSAQQNCDKHSYLKDHGKDKKSSAAKVFMMNVRPIFKLNASKILEGDNLCLTRST